MTAPLTVPFSSNPFDEVVRREQQTRDVQEAMTVGTRRSDPARWARVLNVAREAKLPPDVVDRNLERVERDLTQTRPDYARLTTDAPGLATWLQDADNTALARHELEPLTRAERGARLLGGVNPATWVRDNVGRAALTAGQTGLTDLSMTAGHLAAAYGNADPSAAADFVAHQAQWNAMLRAQAPQYAKDYQTALESIRAAHAAGLRSTPGTLLDFLGAAVRHPGGVLYQAGESLVPFVPAIGLAAGEGAAGAAVGSAVPVVGTTIGAMAGIGAGTFHGMTPVLVGQAINAELQRRGVDVTDATALAAAYRDTTLMKSVRARAQREGLTQAAVASLVASFAGQLGNAARGSGAGVATRALARAGDVSVQSVGQGAADAAGQYAGSGQVDVARSMETAVAMLGQEIGTTAVGGLRGRHAAEPATALAEAHTAATDALRAQHDAQALHELTSAVTEATATASVPDKLKQLIETAAGGEDASHVYFQSGEWDRYWQDRNRSPATAAAELLQDGGRGYDQARATGAPLAVPLGDYVSRIASEPEHFNGLLPIARTRPDGMSLAEAHEYLERLPATLHEIVNDATPAATPEGVRTIGQRVEQQLTAAGVAPSAAKAQATLYESLFQTLGTRTGTDPLALFTRYHLTIGRGVAHDRIAQAAEAARVAREELGAQFDPSLSDEANAATFEAAAATDPTIGVVHAQLPRARTEGGRLKSLRTATEEELRNEYRILTDANATEQTGETVLQNDHHVGNAPWVGTKGAAASARGRVAARAKSLAKIEAEFKARGIDPAEAYMRAAEDAAALEPDAFPFGENAFTQGTEAKAPRGRITIGDNGVSIELLRTANRSTFLHESGHFFLKVLGDVADAPNAPTDLARDYGIVRDWLGAKEGETITRDQHEQFARGFETYLFEGKAPSEGLRGVFYRFKNWLVRVYRDARALDAPLSNDVRGVFARLLATQEEIAAADRQLPRLFDDPRALGLTEAQAAQYERLHAEYRQAAEETLTARLMRDIRREESKEWAKLRAPIEAEVRRDVDASPLYRALALIGDGKNPDGTPLAEGLLPFKLDRADVEAQIGKGRAAQLPRKLFGNEGLSAEVAADMFGYESARAMLEEMAAAPARKDAIRLRTDARMRAEVGERMTDADVHTAAVQAMLNEKRAQVHRMELELLASNELASVKDLVRSVTKRVPPSEALKVEAERLVREKPMREIGSPAMLRTLETGMRRSATEARDAVLRGDLAAAFDAKEREIVASAAYQAAVAARDAMRGTLDEFKTYFRRDREIAATHDLELVNAARAILAAFGLGHAEKSVDAYLEPLARYEPDVYAALKPMIDEATAQAQTVGGSWKNLSYGDFQDLRDVAKALWTVARESRVVEIDGQRIEKDAIVGELASRAAELTKPDARPGLTRALEPWDKAKLGLMGVRAGLRRMEHWARAMDNGADDGRFRRYLWNPVSEATTRFRVAKDATLKRYAAIAKQLDGHMRYEAIPAPELGYTFKNTGHLLGAMLHTGNESNLSKLLRGYHWGEQTETGALDRTRWDAFVRRAQREGVLTKAHYDYLQAVWDLFDSFKADAQRAHRAMYGYYFDEIPAQAFNTAYGQYRGGYVPAKVDPWLVSEGAARAERDAIEHGNNSYMFPTTGRGFTKARVETYAKPLLLDAQLVPTHIDAALRFAHIEPAVKQVGRVVMDRRMGEALDALDPAARSDLLVPWLQRAARQTIDTPTNGLGGRFVDRSARALRQRTGLQLMAFNVTVAAAQLTDIPGVLVRVGPNAVARGMWSYLTNGGTMVEEIHTLSPYMATRESAGMMEVRRVIDHIMLDRSPAGKAADWVGEHAMFLARGIQHAIDHATWQGAYEEAIGKGERSDQAVRHADSVVREVLGAYEPESLSRFETSTPLVRLFSMFYSFFNTRANLLGSESAAVMRTMGLRKGAGRLAYVYTMGLLLPAVLNGLITKGLRGQAFDEDDDGPWDDVGHMIAGDVARMVPLVGPATMAAVDLSNRRRTDLLTSPAIHAIESAVAVPADVYHAIRDGLTRRHVQDLFTLLGLLSNLPLAPLAKPIAYVHDVETGKAPRPTPLELTRGLVVGQ